MESVSHDFFAGSCFAFDKHRRGAWGHKTNETGQFLHLRALPDKPRQGIERPRPRELACSSESKAAPRIDTFGYQLRAANNRSA